MLFSSSLASFAGTALHTTWLWHLHQPVYWPDKRAASEHYENAWDTIQQQDAGRPHPSPEILRDIFGLADRVAAYQYRSRDSVNGLLGYANAGVQVSYSGALMENVQSLGSAGRLGYGSTWYQPNQQARGWTTGGGKPRLDLLNFTYHHALAPLLSDETLEMELRIHRRQMEIVWGTSPAVSRGYFPAETCFTERMIPILKKVGIEWSVVANNHLSRACTDFPLVLGSGGENCDIPNRADQLNPAQGASNYKTLSIERGCSPTAAMPFAFQPRYARQVDAETGAESKLILVPSDQALGWRDSYSGWDVNLLNDLNARNNPAKPALALFAHDGDNAWSGGYSYYQEWVPSFASQASGKGFELSSVEQYLAEFPPATNDLVHIEDGGWVFADGDFGSPIFVNWHWPPSHTVSGVNVVDPSVGVSDKADNWRVIIATENRVKTAQQLADVTPRVDQVRDPGSFATAPNAVELGWHYYLGSLDSGFVYYGCHHDECQRAVTAQSNAVRNVNGILAGNPGGDTTPPTVFIPQRHPWNPGGTNFGVQYGYRVTAAPNSDFWVWTYAYDVSGITNVSLKLRLNGTNPPTSDQFKTYAGGPLAGAWQTSNMTQRVVAPVLGVTPQYLADYYYAKVGGVTNSYVDYYVTATDARGNTYKSPIQHVWVGQNLGGGGANTNGCNGRVCVLPASPTQGNSVTISYDPTGGPIAGAGTVKIHLGWNNWATVANPDPAMTFNAASNRWEFATNIPPTVTQLDCVFNNGSGTWDNNNGQDWHFTAVTNGAPQPPSAPTGLTASPVSTNQITLTWSAAAGATGYIVQRASSTLATTATTSFSDNGLLANTAYCYSIITTNSVGSSSPTAAQCATTLAIAPTNFPPFIMDGAVDSANFRVASNGMTIYAVLRGSRLYVATWSPGNSGGLNDHFIFVTDQLLPAATANAPWAKAGKVAVATGKPFLAGESASAYVSWFNAPAGTQTAKAVTSAGQMEGTIDLVAAFGALPTNIYLCAAAYQTADGGALASQCPTGSGPDIDPNEFFVIPTSALSDSNGDNLFDLLDPQLGFRLWMQNAAPDSVILNWGAMPGHVYGLLYTDALGSGWSRLAGSSNLAGPLQTTLSMTNVLSGNVSGRFFRAQLLR